MSRQRTGAPRGCRPFSPHGVDHAIERSVKSRAASPEGSWGGNWLASGRSPWISTMGRALYGFQVGQILPVCPLACVRVVSPEGTSLRPSHSGQVRKPVIWTTMSSSSTTCCLSRVVGFSSACRADSANRRVRSIAWFRSDRAAAQRIAIERWSRRTCRSASSCAAAWLIAHGAAESGANRGHTARSVQQRRTRARVPDSGATQLPAGSVFSRTGRSGPSRRRG